MEIIIGTLVSIAIVIGVIALVVVIVKSKLNKVTRSYLGMGLGETADFLSKGLKEEASLPKSITDLTAVYRPQIERDFPQFSYANMKSMAENALINAFNAIEKCDSSLLSDVSKRLTEQVDNIIADNRSTNTRTVYDDVKISKTGISKYTKTSTTSEAIFEISLSHLFYSVRGNSVVSGNREQPTTAAYKVILSYNQEEYLTSTSVVFASACPNCGAPISAIGDKKFCTYCGSGLTEIADRIWQVNSFSRFK